MNNCGCHYDSEKQKCECGLDGNVTVTLTRTFLNNSINSHSLENI